MSPNNVAVSNNAWQYDSAQDEWQLIDHSTGQVIKTVSGPIIKQQQKALLTGGQPGLIPQYAAPTFQNEVLATKHATEQCRTHCKPAKCAEEPGSCPKWNEYKKLHRTCISCKWHMLKDVVEITWPFWRKRRYHVCKKAPDFDDARDFTSGTIDETKITYPTCEDMRRHDYECGIEGKDWEPREE